MQLQCNVGEKDRKYRLAGGMALLAGAIVGRSLILAIIGAALLISGYKRICLLYTALGVNTNKDGNNNPPAPPAA